MGRTIAALLVDIGANDAPIQAALASVGVKARSVNADLKALGSTPLAAAAEKSLQSLKTAMGDITNAQQKVAERATLAARGLEQMGGASKLTDTQLRQTNKTLQEGVSAYEALGRGADKDAVALRAMSKEITDQQAKMAAAKNAVELHTQAVEQQAQAMQKVSTALRSAGTTLTAGLTVPLVGLATVSTKAAIDFESSFAGVRKTVDATDEEFKQMERSFRDLAKTIPINVNELNRLGEAAGALGIPKAAIVDFARVMAELGVTTNVTADQAAESIAKVQNIFGAAGQETERFASTLVDLGNKGASTEGQILEMATRLASAGNSIGITEQQVLGISAAIANVGIEAEAGGSAMSRVMTDIAVAVAHGGEAVEKFAKIADKSGPEFTKIFNTDAAQALRLFIEGLGHVNERGGNLILTLEDLGFSEIRQSNLLRALAGNYKDFGFSLDTASAAWEANTALTTEAEKRFETTASKIEILKNHFADISIELGQRLLPHLEKLLPVLERLGTSLANLVDKFAALPEGVQTFALVTAAAFAIAGPVMLALGGLLSMWVNIRLAILAAKAAQVGFGVAGAGAAAGGAASGAAGGLTGLAAGAIGGTMMLPSLGIVDKRSLRERAADPIRPWFGYGGSPGSLTLPFTSDFPDLTGSMAAGPRAPISPFDADLFGMSGMVGPAVSPKTKQTKAEIAKSKKEHEEFEQALIDLQHEANRVFEGLLLAVNGRQIGTGMSKKLEPRLGFIDGLFGQGALQNQFGGAFPAAGPAKLGAKTFDATTLAPSFTSDLASSVPNSILAAIQGGGSKLQAAGSALGLTLFGKDSSLTKSITGLFSADGFLGKTLSSAVPIIGSLIGPALQGLGKLWGKVFGTEGRDTVRQFASDQGGFPALHDRLGTLGADGEALWKNLTQGVGRNNPEQAKAAIDKVTAAFEAQRQKILALQAQLGTVGSRLSGITTLTPDLQKQLESAFNAKTPEEYARALQGITGELDKQQAKFDLIKSTLAKYGIALTEASGEFKQQTINQAANEAITDFKVLTDQAEGAGVSVSVAVHGMSDQLSKFAQDAKKAGVEVPEEMRKILQAAIDNGDLFEENGKKITDMKDLGLTFGTTMETVMNKTIPDAIARLNTVLEALARFLKIDLPNAAAEGAAGVQGEFDANPPVLRPEIEWPDGGPQPDFPNGFDGQPEGFAGGTGGWRNFGTGTAAILHGVEAVVTPSQLSALMRQPRRGAQSSEDAAPPIIIQITGPVLAAQDYVEQHLIEPILNGISRYHRPKFGRLVAAVSS